MKIKTNNIITILLSVVLIQSCNTSKSITNKQYSESDEFLTEIKDICLGSDNGIFIVVDFTKHSCENRIYLFESNNNKILLLHAGKTLHGFGLGSTASKPEFSNEIGTNCSSLGLYELLCTDTMKIGRPCIRLKGLSATNSNAAKRGILIHPSPLTSSIEGEWYGQDFPLSIESAGCFSVDNTTFEKITALMQRKNTIRLYAHY